MRLATFNLLHGVPVIGISGLRPEVDANGKILGPPEVHSDAPLRDAVSALNADIVGLQEVDVHQPRSGGHHQVRVVADAMAAPWWRFVPSVRGTPGVDRDWEPADDTDHHGHDGDHSDQGPRYGIGLVSRFPVLHWRATVFNPAPLSLPLLIPATPRPRVLRIPDEPRPAIAAVIDGPGGPFTVATAHLSFVPGYNAHQLRQLRRWLHDLPRPLVLLGDFNLPGQLPRRLTGWKPLAIASTYPSTRPRVQFDHILVDGLSAGRVAAARGEALTLPVSDHCALAVDLTIP